MADLREMVDSKAWAAANSEVRPAMISARDRRSQGRADSFGGGAEAGFVAWQVLGDYGGSWRL